MAQSDDERVPPDIPALLRVLQHHSVSFVLVGSVAVEACGADVGVPGDLDVVPALDRDNLQRLAAAMRQLEALSWPVTGRWETDDHGEVRWIEYDTDDPRRGQRLPPPDPDDISTYDSLFSTIHGELDIVPRISGAYDDLHDRASPLRVHGVDGIRVMSIEDLLVHLTVPRRKKDVSRVAVLRARQRESVPTERR